MVQWYSVAPKNEVWYSGTVVQRGTEKRSLVQWYSGTAWHRYSVKNTSKHENQSVNLFTIFELLTKMTFEDAHLKTWRDYITHFRPTLLSLVFAQQCEMYCSRHYRYNKFAQRSVKSIV